MAIILGPETALALALPGGIDSAVALNWQLRNGTTAQQLIANAAAAVGAVNQQMVAEYGNVFTITERDWSQYREGAGSRTMTPVKSELGSPDPVRSERNGHMLPLTDYEDHLNWTREYLRDAWDSQIAADMQLIANRWRNRIEYDLVWRMLFNTDVQIGASGYSPGWAIGTGSSLNYIPPQYGAYVHTSSHTHFIYTDGNDAAAYKSQLDDMMLELRHHGHTGRLTCIFADADLALIQGMTGYVRLTPADIQAIGSSSAVSYITQGEVTGTPGELIGYYNGGRGIVLLYANAYFPTGYLFMTKSYGSNNAANGLAVRVHPDYGFGMYVNPQVDSSLNPQLSGLRVEALHGVGTNDRTNGVAAYVATSAAAYVNPTLT